MSVCTRRVRGRASIFSYSGANYYIRTRDHNPAHVHVKTADGEIRIYLGREEDGGVDNYGREFGEYEFVWGKLKSSKVRTLVDHLESNLSDAWATWHQIYG